MDIDRKISGPVLTGLSKVILVAAGLLAGLVIVRIFIMPFTVGDDTMVPNFRKGDTLFILRHITPKIGDVVLFDSPVEQGKVMLKRVIAAEGDSVEVKDRDLYVNGSRASFSWKTASADSRIFPMSFSYRDNFPVIKLKRKEYFMLGDNLDYAMDSRYFGVVGDDKIIGRHLYTLHLPGK